MIKKSVIYDMITDISHVQSNSNYNTYIPAFLAARTPAGASSNTRIFFGSIGEPCLHKSCNQSLLPNQYLCSPKILMCKGRNSTNHSVQISPYKETIIETNITTQSCFCNNQMIPSTLMSLFRLCICVKYYIGFVFNHISYIN